MNIIERIRELIRNFLKKLIGAFKHGKRDN